MDIILYVLMTAFPLIFTANLVMSVIKYLAAQSVTTTWLRFMLAAISIMGVIATSAINGTPVNFDSISGVTLALVQSIIVAIGAHFSYKAIKNA